MHLSLFPADWPQMMPLKATKEILQSRLICLLFGLMVSSFCFKHISVLHHQIPADDVEGSHRKATSDIVSS